MIQFIYRVIYLLLVQIKINSVLTKTVRSRNKTFLSIEEQKKIFSDVFEKVIRKKASLLIPKKDQAYFTVQINHVLDKGLNKALLMIEKEGKRL